MRIFRWHTCLRPCRTARFVSNTGYAQLDVFGPQSPDTYELFGKPRKIEIDLYEVRIWRDGAEFEESAASYSSATDAKRAIRQAIGVECRTIDAF